MPTTSRGRQREEPERGRDAVARDEAGEAAGSATPDRPRESELSAAEVAAEQQRLHADRERLRRRLQRKFH